MSFISTLLNLPQYAGVARNALSVLRPYIPTPPQGSRLARGLEAVGPALEDIEYAPANLALKAGGAIAQGASEGLNYLLEDPEAARAATTNARPSVAPSQAQPVITSSVEVPAISGYNQSTVGYPAGSKYLEAAGYTQPDRSQLGPVPAGVSAQLDRFSQEKGIPVDSGRPTPELATAAAPAPPRIRAIRMPNGSFLFTNQNYGGEEVDVPAAGAAIRAQDRANVSPTSSTMSALVRASARQAAGERMPSLNPRQVAGPAFNAAEPGVSFIEGTPDQQMAEKLQDNMAKLQLSQLAQEQQLAELPATQRMQLENPDIQTASFVINRFGPALQGVQRDASMKLAAITTPGAEGYIEDPKARQQAERMIRDEYDAKSEQLRSLMAVIMRQRLPQ